MLRINGDANVGAIKLAADAGETLQLLSFSFFPINAYQDLHAILRYLFVFR